MILNAAALFLAGALSFAVEPLVARMLLPRLGGAPAVWIVSLLFFQAALLVGYAYAHALARVRDLRVQVAIHLVVLAAAGLALPPALRLAVSGDPVTTTIGTLAATIGLPYIALVATSPLLQHWLGRSELSADPYVLYAASNGGSLLGLLAYPFVLGPLFGLAAQAAAWTAGYAIAAVLAVACGLTATLRRSRTVRFVRSEAIPATRSLRWIALAALPAAWLGAVTTHLTSAIAPVPLLWVAPLAVYLATLIIAFAPSAWRAGLDRAFARAVVIAGLRDVARVRALAGPLVIACVAVVLAMHLAEPLVPVLAIHLAALFVGGLVCHTRLADDRPAAGRLTWFYLAVALGGAVGGAFAAVVAPLLFHTLLEYPLVVGAFVASGLAFGLAPRGAWSSRPSVRALVTAIAGVAPVVLVAFGALHWFLVPIALGAATLLAFGASRTPLLAGAVVLAALVVADASPIPGPYRELAASRSFFGVNRVLASADAKQHVLLNGTVVHGAQLVAGPREPVSYYSREGPLGDLLSVAGATGRVAVIGLGAGAIACYGTSRQSISFYEIDPAVVAIARTPSFFSYLAECPPERVVLGDARITMGALSDATYDVIVVDAYSGDSMPVHLLTREAFALYRRVLAPGGVIALHLSNAYFDLEPLVAALAADAGLAARLRDDTDGGETDAPIPHPAGWSPSTWALLGSLGDVDARVGGLGAWRPLRERSDLRIWTDDYVNLLAVRR